jgi:hypothetical protein
MYDELSDIQYAVKLFSVGYYSIWEQLVTLRKIETGVYVSNSCQETCIWQGVEAIAKHLCKLVSKEDRNGAISVALDDDKIDGHMRGENLCDTFGLKYCTHVRTKGLVAYTAVSSGINLPLGMSFERINDTSAIYFKRILNCLFGNGAGDMANLCGVQVHSD